MPKPATSINDLFPDKWLTPQHLQGKTVPATISAVGIEELWQDQTKQKEPKLVLSFQGKTLRLPLNKTQATAIAEITGNDQFAQWVGTEIQLSPAVARNKKPTIAIEAPPKAQAPKPALEGSNRGTTQPKLTEPAAASSATPVELGAATVLDQTDYQDGPFSGEQ